jgi:uncharacterized protein affecting Mg2+/Co2+ transport
MAHPEFTCSVKVAYLDEQSQPTQGVFAFAYTITIVNATGRSSMHRATARRCAAWR